MNINYSVLNNDEKAIFNMRSLYKQYGYSQFKMSKFEEYDLYVRNKDFLVSENIITFTDTDGKLMALKPDVTLSIIKNSEYASGQVQKVFYDENVYRVSKGTNSFKEIMQVGLECIGDIDTYNIFEVILLAAKSLNSISENYILDVSNIDIVSDMIEECELDSKSRKELVKCIGEKNIHGIDSVCNDRGVDAELCNRMKKLIALHGNHENVMATIKELALPRSADAVNRMEQIIKLLDVSGYNDKINIDFSVISDTHYYNGFVFKGFIEGISSRILSGGQYDNLMKRMKLNSGAIGFAVYLDVLERFEYSEKTYDVDYVVWYDDTCDISKINAAVAGFIKDGMSVMATKTVPTDIKYRELYKLNECGVEKIEKDA